MPPKGSIKGQISGLLSTPKPSESVGTASSMDSPQASVDALREMVENNHIRVRDLFKAWDEDKNGKVNKKEFRKALVALGMDATRTQMAARRSACSYGCMRAPCHGASRVWR